MLRGLAWNLTQVNQVSFTVLVILLHLRDRSINTIGSAPSHHVLHAIHLTYLDEMQDASV